MCYSFCVNSVDYSFQRQRREECPFCGESIELLIDLSEGSHSYLEDCEVCCKPIAVSVYVPEDDEVSEEQSLDSDFDSDDEDSDFENDVAFKVILKKESD
ncbi:MAG: CPXCG motif-containing cysteine-rich protein [Proteobacteria bacterium]|nr:CPXCG motif-containing cysteine-rich protein [Pseudomonadota bacterium]